MKGNKKIQQQITIGAYKMEVIQQSFTSTLKWLEFYIEKSGYSGNWKRQISETITRQDLNDQPNEIKGFMETALLGLNGLIEDGSDFVFENLQEKFYSWLAESGIGIDDCPEGLIECLVDIHKVLNNEGKEFAERVSEEASESIEKMTPEERRKNFYRTFTVAQRLMDDASARQKSLEGKTYKDVETKNQFSGNHDQGKKIFGQIKDQQQLGQAGSSSTTQPNNPQQQEPYLTPSGDAVINGEVYEEDPNTKLDEGQVNVTRQQNNYHPEIWVPVGIGGVALITASAYWVFRKKR